MPYHKGIDFGDERYREGLSGAERLDDELLRVIADLQGLERCNRHFCYGADIGVSLAPDCDFRFHASGFLLLDGQRQKSAGAASDRLDCLVSSVLFSS